MIDEETARCDMNNYYHKYHMVEVDFGEDAGSDEDDFVAEQLLLELGKRGKEPSKITKETLYKEKPVDNAEIFLSTLHKSRSKHLKKLQDEEPAEEPLARAEEPDQEEVILDLNPEKFEKPKDYLFFDFFSLYAKNSITQKKRI